MLRDESHKEKLGYYSIEKTDDPCFITIAVNSKEYFEKFESENMNRKNAKALEKFWHLWE